MRQWNDLAKTAGVLVAAALVSAAWAGAGHDEQRGMDGHGAMHEAMHGSGRHAAGERGHGMGHGDGHGKAHGGGHGGGHGDGHGDGHGGGHARSAVGAPGDPAQVDRVIEVDLLDSMRLVFRPDTPPRAGETVRFVVTNKGGIRHEFSIGSAEEQARHREMMRRMPGMVHEDGNSVTVEPGATRELVWKFDGEDEVVFSCNIPGHSEAGMTETVRLGTG